MFLNSDGVTYLYKLSANIVRNVSEGKGSVKDLVYNSGHRDPKALYALVATYFKKTDVINNLLEKCEILKNEPRLDEWLTKILITQLLWGRRSLGSRNETTQTVLSYEAALRAHLSDISDNTSTCADQVDKPRYVRINTLKISIIEGIERFTNEGWVLKKYTGDYVGFLDAVSSLDSAEFMIDLHVPSLLIFPPRTQFHRHPAYLNGSIALQDKASCLPIQILNPEPGSTVLDMCAAPGMKTTQCAAMMENRGLIYASEIYQKRFKVLEEMIEWSGASCVTAMNVDAIDLNSNSCPNVKYILVDPSCSGSGQVDRLDVREQNLNMERARVRKLANFQTRILKYALTKFPGVKRVVYSTCSVYPQENEEVVRSVLEVCVSYKLVPADKFVKEKWLHFGSPEFGDIGKYCLYAKPDVDLTTGFFIAVFERLEDGETNPFLNCERVDTYYRKSNQATEEKRVGQVKPQRKFVRPQENVRKTPVVKHSKKKRKKVNTRKKTGTVGIKRTEEECSEEVNKNEVESRNKRKSESVTPEDEKGSPTTFMATCKRKRKDSEEYCARKPENIRFSSVEQLLCAEEPLNTVHMELDTVFVEKKQQHELVDTDQSANPDIEVKDLFDIKDHELNFVQKLPQNTSSYGEDYKSSGREGNVNCFTESTIASKEEEEVRPKTNNQRVVEEEEDASENFNYWKIF